MTNITTDLVRQLDPEQLFGIIDCIHPIDSLRRTSIPLEYLTPKNTSKVEQSQPVKVPTLPDFNHKCPPMMRNWTEAFDGIKELLYRLFPR